MKKLRLDGCFAMVEEIFEEFIETHWGLHASQIGYIDGLKGKQRWLSDVETMYATFKRKHEIVMWCLPGTESSAKKKDHSSEKENEGSTAPPPRKKSGIAQKICEVEDIITELKAKHGSTYSISN